MNQGLSVYKAHVFSWLHFILSLISRPTLLRGKPKPWKEVVIERRTWEASDYTKKQSGEAVVTEHKTQLSFPEDKAKKDGIV